MNYQNIYNQIIHRAKNRKLNGYKEKHHIVPKSIGGLDIIENIVELTAKEHFLCHMLLCEIYPKNNKLRHALFLMAIGKRSKNKQYAINSRTYERLKKEHSTFLTGKSQSYETKAKKSKAMKKVWEAKSYDDLKQISKKREETKIKNGTNKISPETAKKISISLKKRKITWDTTTSKPVIQYDLNENFIKEWPSIAEAKRWLGSGDITGCVNGKQKQAGGYVWKFK